MSWCGCVAMDCEISLSRRVMLHWMKMVLRGKLMRAMAASLPRLNNFQAEMWQCVNQVQILFPVSWDKEFNGASIGDGRQRQHLGLDFFFRQKFSHVGKQNQLHHNTLMWMMMQKSHAVLFLVYFFIRGLQSFSRPTSFPQTPFFQLLSSDSQNSERPLRFQPW